MYGKHHVMLSVPIYVLVVRYLSYKEILLSPFLAVFIYFTMVGSVFPDIDWKLSKLGLRHRSPITHSFLIPILIYLPVFYFNLIPIPPQYMIPFLTTFQAFLLGVTSHLLGDNIKTGNLVNVPKRFEIWWYFIQGGIVLVILYLTGFFNLGCLK